MVSGNITRSSQFYQNLDLGRQKGPTAPWPNQSIGRGRPITSLISGGYAFRLGDRNWYRSYDPSVRLRGYHSFRDENDSPWSTSRRSSVNSTTSTLSTYLSSRSSSNSSVSGELVRTPSRRLSSVDSSAVSFTTARSNRSSEIQEAIPARSTLQTVSPPNRGNAVGGAVSSVGSGSKTPQPSAFGVGGSIAGWAISGAVSGSIAGASKIGSTVITTKHRASENEKNREFFREQRDWAADQFTKAGLPSYLAITARSGSSAGRLAGPTTSQHTTGSSYYKSSLPGDPRSSQFTGDPFQQHMGWGAI